MPNQMGLGDSLAEFPLEPEVGYVLHAKEDRGKNLRAYVTSYLDGATWVPGHSGSALRIISASNVDPLSAQGSLRVESELRMTRTNYTVSVWFMSQSPDTQIFLINRLGSNGNKEFEDGHLRLQGGHVTATLSNEVITSNRTFNDGQWHHVVHVVSKEDGQRLYVDGVREATGRVTEMHNWNEHAPTNRMGALLGGGVYKWPTQNVVTVDELRIYGRPLGEEEIAGVP